MSDHIHLHDHHRNAEFQQRVDRLIAVAEKLGITTKTELDERLERFLTAANPLNGARVVVRAWTDPDFAERLAENATKAVAELGFSFGHQHNQIQLRALFNSTEEHNLVVCTLCSCYPMALLGPPPAWYKSEAYRSRVVRDPRSVLHEFGVQLPESTHVHVWDSTTDLRYLVIPYRPAGTENLSEAGLLELVHRDCLIGTALAGRH